MIERVLRPRLLLALLVALVLSACQVRVASDIGVNADGSGSLVVSVALDEELWTSLTADGFDPFLEFADLAEEGWTSTVEPDDGGQRLELRTTFDGPEGLTDRVEQLHAGLDDEDPRILANPALTVSEDTIALDLQAGLVPPSSTGVDGVEVDVDGEALLRLLEERGDELFRYDLRVTMPGPIESSDADEVDGRSATWHLPATSMRDISVTATTGPANRTIVVAIAAGLLTLALVGSTVALVRRRRRG